MESVSKKGLCAALWWLTWSGCFFFALESDCRSIAIWQTSISKQLERVCLRRGLALNLPTCCSWTFREMQSRGFQTSPWRLALSLLVRFPDPLAFSSQAGTLSMSLPTESSKKCNQPVQAVLQSSTASPLSQKFSEMQLACRDMQVAGQFLSKYFNFCVSRSLS